MSAQFVGEAQCDPLAMEEVREGKAQLLFISPESLLSNPSWLDMLRTAVYQDNLSGFVVDEAHCVKKWLVNTYMYASFASQSTNPTRLPRF